jgi:cell division protein FtsX
MTNVPGNGPSVAEINRRLQRVEDKLDERTATVDMLSAQEKLFQARELNHLAEITSLKERVNRLEQANTSLTKMVVGAFLGLLIQFVILLINIVSKGAAG